MKIENVGERNERMGLILKETNTEITMKHPQKNQQVVGRKGLELRQ